MRLYFAGVTTSAGRRSAAPSLRRRSRCFFSMPSPTTRKRVGDAPSPSSPRALLDRLLVVLHERLAEQRDLVEELLSAPSTIFSTISAGLPDSLARASMDLALAGERSSGGNLGLRRGTAAWRRRCAWRGPCPPPRRPRSRPARRSCTAVQVDGELALRLQALEAADRDVLADLLHQRLAASPRRLPPSAGDVRRVCVATISASDAREGDEILVLRHEVGLAVDLDQRAELRVGESQAPITPSAATRAAALLALAPLLMRSSSSAFFRSPPASASAFLHSIIPSPVARAAPSPCLR